MNNQFTVISRVAKYFVAALIFPLFSLFNSCKEDTGGVGANILPKSDLISAYQTDTTTVLSSMYLKDSVQTNGTYNCLLGSYNDPIFGQTKASIYTQVSSPLGTLTIPWDSNGNITVDSAVLLLAFYLADGNYYGNLDAQTVSVDTLESIMPTEHSGGNIFAYWSDTTIKYGASPIAIQQVTPTNPAINDTLRIRLNKSWVNYVIGKMSTHNAYYYPYFDSLVKGLYIAVSNPLQLPGQGGLWYINLNGAFAGIYVYYHGNTITVPAQPEYYIDFPVGQTFDGPTAAYFTHIDHNYATAPFYTTHPYGKHDSISANNLVYVQSMGGALGRINFPNLAKNWSKLRPVVINEAEVDLTVDAQDLSSSFAPPPTLILYGTDAYSNAYGLPDFGEPYYGGIYNAFNNTYTFVITQYIQKVIDGKDTDRGLYIVPDLGAITANRVVLYGAQHNGVPTNQRMKLKIYYTPLKP